MRNMKMKRLLVCLAAITMSVTVLLASVPEQSGNTLVPVIPKPEQVKLEKGVYSLPQDGISFYIQGAHSEEFTDYMLNLSLKMIPVTKIADADLVIRVGHSSGKGKIRVSDHPDESYVLTVLQKGIRIDAPQEAGAFYALQTLRQLTRDGRERQLVCVTLADSPRFEYRGMHFDVSRHFRPKEFLKKQMDAMALLKMNRLHLHLTDGAGWRIQIDKYPRLTEFAAWRPYRRWMDWWGADRHYCEADAAGAYGGYYTKDDICELLAYARQRHIEIIPEIEMPGHSEEVLAAYPELSCSGKPYTSSDFCIGKEATFTFLQDVLAEVMELFPSEYIHIGGDEAAKTAWKDCPDCRKRMEQEGLADVDRLQSYLIHRVEEFVNAHGKKIIGWDEILQGGLAPNATVMSWRGTEGGITALRSGHDVIMTPINCCYLDYVQDAPFREPVSIGGYMPLEKVYAYEPVEEGLTNEEASHLLGVQANLWSEYITDDSHAEYMYYPRAFAIAEIGWSQDRKKDYSGFRRRVLRLTEQLQAAGYHTFNLVGEYGERKESLTKVEHSAKGAKVIYNLPYSPQYPAAGETTLTDGLRGGWSYGDRRWQGTLQDFDVTVDLGAIRPIHYVGATFMQSVGAWVYLPQRVEIYLSDDGKSFRKVDTVWCDVPEDAPQLVLKPYATICSGQARFVRLHAVKNAREGAWLFTDEIIVN